MGKIINYIKKEVLGNKRISEKTIKRYTITFEELTTLLNTNDPISKLEIGEKVLLIETESDKR